MGSATCNQLYLAEEGENDHLEDIDMAALERTAREAMGMAVA